jgi:O-antigen/teichoic acid export membrane protein
LKIFEIKFLKDTSYFLITALVTSSLGFVTIPIYTRHLSPSDYGLLALFFLFGSVIVSLVSVGLMSSSYRYYFEYKNDQQKFRIFNTTNVGFNLVSFLIFFVAIYFSASWVSKTVFDSNLSPRLIQLSYISGCLNYFIQFFLHLLSAQLKTFSFAVISIVKVLLDIALSFYFIFFLSLTYMARINAILISQVVILIFAFYTVKNLFTYKLSLSCLKESLFFSYPNTPSTIIGLVYQSFDKVMITNYKDMSSLGNYNIGEKFAGIFKLTTDSITRVFNPYFQEKAHENSFESKNDIVRRFYDLSGVYLIGAYTVICFSEELIKLLTTPAFYPSIYIAPIFVFYYLFGAILAMLSVNQIMFGKKLIYQIPVSLVSITINIFLNIFLIPKYGAIGAVIATVISALFADILLLHFGQRAYFMPLNYNKLIKMFLLIMLLTVPVYLLMLSEIHFILKIIYKCILISIFIYILTKLSIFSNGVTKILAKVFPRLFFAIR